MRRCVLFRVRPLLFSSVGQPRAQLGQHVRRVTTARVREEDESEALPIVLVERGECFARRPAGLRGSRLLVTFARGGGGEATDRRVRLDRLEALGVRPQHPEALG